MREIVIKDWAHFSQLAVERGNNQRLFRGVRQENFKLVPKVGRPRFRDRKHNLEDEKEALERFRRAARPHIAYDPPSLLAWMSIAQHHGLPTRLLDWTESPFIALYFAVQNGRAQTETRSIGSLTKAEARRSNDLKFWELAQQKRYLKSTKIQIKLDAAVYVVPIPGNTKTDTLDEELAFREGSNEVRTYRPAHLSPRITVQKAVHTLHDNPVRSWRPAGSEKWLISSKLIIKFKLNLNLVGINEASLFPDLDGISNYYGWLYQRGM